MDYNEEENNVQNEEEKILKDAEENEIKDQVQEELEKEDIENVDGSVKDSTATINADDLSKLLKKFAIGVLFFIAAIAFIAFMHFHMDIDIKGIGNTIPENYETTCNKIFLTWENESYTKARQKKEPGYTPITNASLVGDLDEVDDEYGERYTYKEYEYDEFVAGVIWGDNYNAQDVDNEIVYQAMSISARSRLIAELPNNCVVLKNYNEQAKSFKELDGSEVKYNEITSAVKETNGVIIGRNKKIIAARYDTFTYISKRKEEDTNFKDIFYYQMTHKNEERQQVIPADWVDELEEKKGTKIPKIKEESIKKLASMSLYGAKYLLEQRDSQYELYRVLEYYYGRDIEYYKIETNYSPNGTGAGAIGCMWWPIGSLITSPEDGILYAKGTPETTYISSGFGPRIKPTEGASSIHNAIDIAGGHQGITNIIAVADGEVIEAHSGCVKGDSSCGGGLGNYVKIQHTDGTITRYGHMYSISVKVGDKVKRGQVIGKMGSTGVSTGTHLDFQVIVNGTPVNPLNFVSPSNNRPECSIGGGADIVEGNSNTQSICLSLKNAGYSPSGIAGIMGNIQAESGFNPLAVNSIGCSGIVQWCNTKDSNRLAIFKSIYGENWKNLDAQIEFMLRELSGMTLLNGILKGSGSPGDMAYQFCMTFERPGKAYCENGERQGYANSWLSYVENNCN